MKILSWSLHSHYLPVSKWIMSKISLYVYSDNIFLHFVWLQWLIRTFLVWICFRNCYYLHCCSVCLLLPPSTECFVTSLDRRKLHFFLLPFGFKLIKIQLNKQRKKKDPLSLLGPCFLHFTWSIAFRTFPVWVCCRNCYNLQWHLVHLLCSHDTKCLIRMSMQETHWGLMAFMELGPFFLCLCKGV